MLLSRYAPRRFFSRTAYISDDPSFIARGRFADEPRRRVATARVRGGGEMESHWYEHEGEYLKREEHLLRFRGRGGVPDPPRLDRAREAAAVTGRSAGGLLVGAVVNLDPSLFRCAVAAVPFVDVMTSMCDASIPLTTGEWEEWGNPNEREFHEYMLSYSPMENVPKPGQHAGTWPDVLVTGGLHDPRVAYWEGPSTPQRLREGAGNGARDFAQDGPRRGALLSASGQVQVLREKALEHAFVLDALGLNDDPEARPSWAAAKG